MQMYLLAKFLNKQKYEISLICLANTSLDQWCEKIAHERVQVIRLPYSYKNHPGIFFALKKIFKENRPNLLHIHLWNPASCRLALLAAKACKIPFIITEHDPFSLSMIKLWLKKWLTNDTKAVIAVSRENQKFLILEYAGKNIIHIPNGIDCAYWEKTRIASSDERKKTRNGLSISENQFVIINVAALHKRKGQETLLEAFAQLLQEKTESKNTAQNPVLLLAGEGEHRKYFEDLAQKLSLVNSVKFLGFRSDIPELLHASDLVTLPSHREAFGIAILEAGMAKKPVIASKVGGITDIIDDGKEGILVEPHNAETLKKAISELINNGEKRLRFAAALHEKIMKTFDAKLMAERTAEVYDTLA